MFFFLSASLCSVGKANVASLTISAYAPSAAAISQVKVNPLTPMNINLKTVNKLQVRISS